MQMCRITDVVAMENFAPRAHGYGMPGIVVDGNDVIAVYSASRQAVTRARAGNGPSFIELKTYRWGGHFEGDPCKYRSRAEEEQWKQRCPVSRGRAMLLQSGILTADTINEIETVIERKIGEAIDEALQAPLPDADDALNYVLAE